MADILSDLLNDTIKVLSGKENNLWTKFTGDDARAQAIAIVMDAIIAKPLLKDAFESVMLSTSAAQAIYSTKGLGNANAKTATGIGSNVASNIFGGILSLVDVSVITTGLTTSLTMLQKTGQLQDIWEKTLMEPNIEGVPISTATINTSRNIEVGEQIMVVQSSAKKQYWTDNAVPKLKEWQVDGYITCQMAQLDSLYLIKPSLKLQQDFLDICASSRRPVLFKDNRGNFQFAQITNLNTSEDASYNNAIKVSISLKEYKPFEVNNIASLLESASSDSSILPTMR